MNKAFSALAQRTKEPPISWLMKTALERPNLISLAAGFTDNPSLPVKETTALLNDILKEPKLARSSLQYGSTAGDMQLRDLTADRIRREDGAAKGTPYLAERTVITHGSQQLLYLLTEALCDPGDIILVEDPTYFVFLGIAESRGVDCRGVRLDRDGINLESLETVLKSLEKSGELPRLKALYAVTYFQNPSAITMALEKKRGALALLKRFEKAAGHPIYLLEDAAYRDLRFAGRDVPSALSLPGGPDRTLYAGTYSKPFATGVRVGFGILPPDVFEIVTRIKGNHDFGTSHLLQQILLKALSSGQYSSHVERLQKRYADKAAIFAEAVRKHFPAEARWLEPEGGLYIWAGLPKLVAVGPKSALFQSALEHDVLYVPGELCYCADKTRRAPRNEMRLSFGSANEANLEEGAKRLGKVIASALRGR
ncbi:MAG TPA: PLP-dependent aminotransferase family protein [Methylomirabilota bacterium]|nr:PLP-dependent aminotransferase family protein [Methylomirabilota bacterium]